MDSLTHEIRNGHSFAAVLDGCSLEHCGGRWCCFERKNDARHCGRPRGYRQAGHFLSAQTLELDFDQGNEASGIPYLLGEVFIAQHAAFLYSTLSSTPEAPKSRVVFILDKPIIDAVLYGAMRRALLTEFPSSNQSIKDPARFLYGSNPENGVLTYV